MKSLLPLGAGGMGEVYRANDARLERTVAIKVLPSHLFANPQLKQRMRREAKAISALQRANFCSLHDIGNQDGTHFLVMEYIEGPDSSRPPGERPTGARSTPKDCN
jgi:eukaryotic-like serine/threonine-protein kinase